MTWLAQNWLWLVIGFAGFALLMRTGCFGMMNHSHAGHGGGHNERDDDRPSGSTSTATTATDPVTGKHIATASALTSLYRGHVYYFESEDSRRQFEASPDRFARADVESPAKSERKSGHRRGGCC